MTIAEIIRTLIFVIKWMYLLFGESLMTSSSFSDWLPDVGNIMHGRRNRRGGGHRPPLFVKKISAYVVNQNNWSPNVWNCLCSPLVNTFRRACIMTWEMQINCLQLNEEPTGTKLAVSNRVSVPDHCLVHWLGCTQKAYCRWWNKDNNKFFVA